ncbi:MAG: hypothetical protein R3E91_02260 [Chlamydiales bacterium]
MKDHKTLIIRTVIKPDLMATTLRTRGWLVALGALAILFGGTILPLSVLKVWGIPIFFGSLTLIGFGWLPYRQLQYLTTKPNEIHDDGNNFFFIKKGKPFLKIPKKSIARIEYMKKKHLYGLGIWLKNPVAEKIQVFETHSHFNKFLKESAAVFPECDIFLPYFTQSGIKHLLGLNHAS